MVHPAGSTLVFNGEVYNFRKIREQLEDEGETFRSSGDTEVILAALARWGEEAVERFDGQFALAWCLANPIVTSVILGPRSAEQLDDNVAASGVTLDDDLLAAIDETLAPALALPEFAA